MKPLTTGRRYYLENAGRQKIGTLSLQLGNAFGFTLEEEATRSPEGEILPAPVMGLVYVDGGYRYG